MREVNCFICRTTTAEGVELKNLTGCDCPRCGRYWLTSSADAILSGIELNERQRANISGWLRGNRDQTIDSDLLEVLKTIPTPTVANRAFKILQTIEELSLSIGIGVDFVTQSFIGVSSSIDMPEVDYLVREYLAKEKGFIIFGGSRRVVITPKGYAALDESKQSNAESQIGFCAMWFDDTVLPVWTSAILPAIGDAGYDAKRIDTHAHNNRIDDEIIAMLRKSKFVVADFTGQRGGVYFEAGFALGLGLPVIWTVRKDALPEVHFDNRQYNFVVWEEDKLNEFKAALQNRIEATLGKGKIKSHSLD